MTKDLFIIRHGQTDFNNRGVVQGRGIDSSINLIGQKQASAFYEKYKNIPFDKIYTSNLIRTVQTVQAFIQEGIPYEKLEGLDEISWGISEGKDLNDKMLVDFDHIITSWRNKELDVKIQDGESPNELQYRQKKAMDYIMSKTHEKTILICTHGRAMRSLLCYLTNTCLSKMDDFEHTNTALYVLRYEGKSFNIVEHYNTEHLDDKER